MVKAQSTRIGLTITGEMDEQLETLAQRQQRRKSDVIRLALEAYLQANGFELKEQLEYGGYRPRKADEDE